MTSRRAGLVRRIPRTSPETITVVAVWWEDVIRRARTSLDLSPATVLTIGAVAYEDEDLLVVAQEIDPDEKHWLKSEMDQVRIPKRLVLRREAVGDIRVSREEDGDGAAEAD